MEAELGVGELDRLRVLEVFSVSRCGEHAVLVLEVLDVGSGALEVRVGDGHAGARLGGARAGFPLPCLCRCWAGPSPGPERTC